MTDNLEDLFSLANGLAGESTPVARTPLANGLIISTVVTTDQGPETAIIDAKGAHPVERYGNKREAFAGHQYWTDLAENFNDSTIVTELGYGSLVEAKFITIRLPQQPEE